jgi:hypothetical protein
MSFEIKNLTIKSSGWVQFTVGKNVAYAKVFEEDSAEYGIQGGNISKLSIPGVYNFDRGLDMDNAPEGMIESIIEHFAVGGEGYSFLKNHRVFD